MNCISILYCLSFYDVAAEDNEVYLVNCHRNSNDTIIDLTPLFPNGRLLFFGEFNTFGLSKGGMVAAF